jgi:hypothetical protein
VLPMPLLLIDDVFDYDDDNDRFTPYLSITAARAEVPEVEHTCRGCREEAHCIVQVADN